MAVGDAVGVGEGVCVAVGGDVGVGEGVCVTVGGDVGVGDGVCVAVGSGVGVGDGVYVAVGGGVCVAVGGGVCVLAAAASTGASAASAAVATGSTSGESSPQATSAISAAAVTAMPPITRNKDLPPLLEMIPSLPYQMLPPSTTRLCPVIHARVRRLRGLTDPVPSPILAWRDATTTTACEARVRRYRAPESALWRRRAPVCPSCRA